MWGAEASVGAATDPLLRWGRNLQFYPSQASQGKLNPNTQSGFLGLCVMCGPLGITTDHQHMDPASSTMFSHSSRLVRSQSQSAPAQIHPNDEDHPQVPGLSAFLLVLRWMRWDDLQMTDAADISSWQSCNQAVRDTPPPDDPEEGLDTKFRTHS